MWIEHSNEQLFIYAYAIYSIDFDNETDKALQLWRLSKPIVLNESM